MTDLNKYSEYLSIRQNYRPDWMEGLELDFYIDEHKIAAEVQGAQHYSFVEFFHKSQDDYRAQQQRDANKKYLCRLNRIELVEIYTEKDADLFIAKIKEICAPVEIENTVTQKEKERRKGMRRKLNKLFKKHYQRWGD
jgi:hypothetical protein